MKIALIIAAILIAVGFFLWLGLRIQPRPFPNYPQRTPELQTVPLPAGLPAPVERYYRAVYGDRVPVIESAVLTGRAVMRPVANIPLPARFVMIHQAGQAYRHYFEATFFGIPFLKVNEGYLDGQSYFESPMGAYHDDPNTNQGANLALWAEAGWFPALWVTDSRVHWKAVDDHTTLLTVPFEDREETFVVRFNPQTGLVDLMEAMRFRNPGDRDKILWIASGAAPDNPAGWAMWLDQGHPWATFNPEDIVFNVDVSQYIRGRGQAVP